MRKEHREEEIGLEEFLEAARADAGRSHGVRAALLLLEAPPWTWHLPGAAGLPRTRQGSVHPSLLGPPEQELLLASTERGEARRVADRLRAEGRRARAVSEALPSSVLSAGPPTAALWSPDAYLAERASGWPRSRVLDLGCGSGRDAVYLAQRGHRVVGVDRLPDALALARRRAAVHEVEVEWAALRWPTAGALLLEDFDAVIAIRFQHPDLLREFGSRLAPRTRLLLHGLAAGKGASRGFAVEGLQRELADGWRILDGPRERGDAGLVWVELEAERL
jgi:SAM-dependent methyltransferase